MLNPKKLIYTHTHTHTNTCVINKFMYIKGLGYLLGVCVCVCVREGVGGREGRDGFHSRG